MSNTVRSDISYIYLEIIISITVPGKLRLYLESVVMATISLTQLHLVDILLTHLDQLTLLQTE
jgi:hypothetical protein